jgi:hypothetical protein
MESPSDYNTISVFFSPFNPNTCKALAIRLFGRGSVNRCAVEVEWLGLSVVRVTEKGPAILRHYLLAHNMKATRSFIGREFQTELYKLSYLIQKSALSVGVELQRANFRPPRHAPLEPRFRAAIS